MFGKLKNMKNFSYLFLLLFVVALPSASFSQAISDYEIEEILRLFKNYRFGNVYVYQMTDNSEVTKYFRAKEEASSGGNATGGKEAYEDLAPEIKSVIDNYYEEGVRKITQQLETQGIAAPDAKVLETAIEYVIASKNKKVSYYQAYVVTTKPEYPGAIPGSYIGMVISKKNTNRPVEIQIALKNQLTKDLVFTRSELKDTKLDPNEYGASNLYNLVDIKFKQGDMKNVSLEAKDIGTVVKWAGKEYGTTTSLVTYDTRYDISEKVLQQYKKISDGNPTNIGEMTNEVTVSPDLIRWQSYSKSYQSTYDEASQSKEIERDSLGNPIVDMTESSNNNLPDFGMELKYGVEGLYYSSFWSDRLALNAIWKNMKLGVILPTNGWASLSSDLYNQNRKFTHASSVGIGGKIDFPFYLIKMSDVFEFNFGYVFGDAREANFNPRPKTANEFLANRDAFAQNDYLLRGNAQLHYTFAMNIDEDYSLRFGLGGTFYSVESWGSGLDTSLVGNTRTNKVDYTKKDNESVGGVSGRVDFLATGNATPYGFSAMYFDETLGLSGWLQIPVIENIFALRLEANGYAVAFKSIERPWENSSIFTPMLRVIYNF